MESKLTAEEILKILISEILRMLVELTDEPDGDERFIEGEKTALVECLEILQDWEDAAENGLDINVEEIFPLK